MSTHNICFRRDKKNIMWIPPLICSYAVYVQMRLILTNTTVCNNGFVHFERWKRTDHKLRDERVKT